MKDRELNISELKDNQLVYIEFNFTGVTQCGTDEEFEQTLDNLVCRYEDGLYVVNLTNKTFVNVNTKESVYFYHNLVGWIYEWRN